MSTLVESYPKTFRENLEYRIQLRQKCETDENARITYYELCRRDILFWINTSCWTYNPRKSPSTIPFVTWKFQDEMILKLKSKIERQEDLLIEKSRDMGVTWCVLVVFQWFWQFGPSGSDFLIGSRREQYVDKTGDMDSLFPKLDFSIRNQPTYLLPEGFDISKHRTYMNLINPKTGSTIGGEATNTNFGRGARRRAILFDEFAFWDVSSAAWRSTADTTNCRIVVSTPYGLNNQFAKLRHSGAIEVDSLHWRRHPEKDEAWYESEKKRRGQDKVGIAQELDISYEGSEDGILFAWEDLRKAQKVEMKTAHERIVTACDPAGEGDDEAVIYSGNNCSLETKSFKDSRAMELAAENVTAARRWKSQVIVIDSIGNDVADGTRLLLKDDKNIKVIMFKGSEKANDSDKFYNLRAEAYHFLSQQIKSGNVQLPEDHELLTQLNATKYKKKDGRIILIPKEEIKSLIGHSPDRADAFCMLVWGQKFTHSVSEIKQREQYRQFRQPLQEVEVGSEYGDWNDAA